MAPLPRAPQAVVVLDVPGGRIDLPGSVAVFEVPPRGVLEVERQHPVVEVPPEGRADDIPLDTDVIGRADIVHVEGLEHHVLDTAGRLESFCEYNARHRASDSWGMHPQLAEPIELAEVAQRDLAT